MTIETAKKLLGRKYQHLDDEAIKKRIASMRLLASNMVDKVLEMDYKYNHEKCDHPSQGIIC